MQKSTKLFIQILIISSFLYTPMLVSAINSTPGIRQQVMDSLDTFQHKQTDMYNMLKGKASKAGARRIIRMIEDLSEKKADKADLDDVNKAIAALQQDIQLLSTTLVDDIEKISNSLIKISTQTTPHQRIQILAEIKNEQKNIKERIAELNGQIQKILAKTSRNRLSEMTKLAGKQDEINDEYAEIKQYLQENIDIVKRNMSFALFFFIMVVGALVAWVYYYIYHQKQVKNEIYNNTQTIVKEQYERLLEQLYIEEHEDGRLTADDLKQMSERVKKKVIRQNWAKRKIEERPAFI